MKKLLLISLLFIVILIAFFITVKKQNFPINSIPQNPVSKTTDINTSNLSISVFAENLNVPWAIAFLPDKRMLVTEREGKVLIINQGGAVEKEPAANFKVYTGPNGEGGLLGIALSPNFTSNHFVYIYYNFSSSNNNTLNRVSRFMFKNNKLVEEKIIVDRIPASLFHNGGRLAFGPDGFLYIATGDSQNSSLAQNKNSLAGKILRVSEEGRPAEGNPFGNLIYSLGHRNPEGFAWDSGGNLWETENGPSGIWPNCCQDEINKIVKGGNYGWPDSVGNKIQAGTIGPVIQSERDTWAPSGAAIVGKSLFFAGLRGEALYEYNLESGKLTTHFKNQYGRLREVVSGPDGNLYITTSNKDGRGNPKQGDDKLLKVEFK